MTNETEKTKQSPVAKLRVGLITANIWNNDGYLSVSFERRYKAKDGDWRTSYSFDAAGVAELSLLTHTVHRRMIELYQQQDASDA